jgi:hypothetical protein
VIVSLFYNGTVTAANARAGRRKNLASTWRFVSCWLDLVRSMSQMEVAVTKPSCR